MVAGERRAPVIQYPEQASIGDERRRHVFHHNRQPRAMKGGVDEQMHVIPKVDEKAYKAVLDRIPTSNQKYDPRGTARPPDPSKPRKKSN
jgi:hypothetical protein